MSSSQQDRKSYASDFIEYDIDNVMFFENPMIDSLVTTVVALGSEVWTTKRRVKILESVLIKNGVPAEQVETYVPTEEEELAWRAERDEFIDKAYSALKRGGKDSVAYDAHMEEKLRGGKD